MLALTDQLSENARYFEQALSAASRLSSPYDRAYYTGLAWERRAKARCRTGGHGSGAYVHEWLQNAMEHFEKAEGIRPSSNDDSILRWNACVRFLMQHPDIRPREEDVPEPILSE